MKDNQNISHKVCHRTAECTTGKDAQVALVQGGTSLTFVTTSFAVQFGSQEHALYLDLERHVEVVYPDFALHTELVGNIVDVQVYNMTKVQRTALYLARGARSNNYAAVL